MIPAPKVTTKFLSKNQYIQDDTVKKQIVVHHTAGNSSGVNQVADWESDGRGKIGTAFVISGKGAKNCADGEIIQAFSSKHSAYHLGIKTEVFKARKLPWINVDFLSIGIEVCNWGGLTLENGKYLNYVDTEVKAENVCILDEPFKGYKYWHNYTTAQIESLRQLLLYLGDTYKIPLDYSYERMFTITNAALTGEKGLYTHNSYRKDKVDIYPHPAMIEMFESLT